MFLKLVWSQHCCWFWIEGTNRNVCMHLIMHTLYASLPLLVGLIILGGFRCSFQFFTWWKWQRENCSVFEFNRGIYGENTHVFNQLWLLKVHIEASICNRWKSCVLPIVTTSIYMYIYLYQTEETFFELLFYI